MPDDSLPPIVFEEPGIPYADSSEAALLDLFSRETAHDEYGLVGHDLPWAVHYHLTPRRKSLLAWMDFGPDASVLELGAGCGALTSLLVEKAGRVVAAEGSPDRAKVIQMRCRTAKNLRIVVGNAANLPFTGEFSHVILVGVLEYAQAYVRHERPHEHLLRAASRYLRPDGCLILAIENAMGHKYLAGMPEDHTGRPYCGVNGYAGPFGARTFDRPALAALLTDAGFAAQSWFYPSPDYKVPDAVLSQHAFETPSFDPLPLLDLPTRDYGGRHEPTFNERTFLQSALDAGCAHNFMNSFLVLAGKSAHAPALAADSAMLATAFNVDGCPRAFQTQTRFDARDDGSISVSRRRVHDLAPRAFASGEQHVKPVEPYLAGYVSVLMRVLSLLERGDAPGAGAALLAWMDIMTARSIPASPQIAQDYAAFCAARIGRPIYAECAAGPFVPGALLDAHPGNVMFHPESGDVRFIDLEWKLAAHLPLQLVIDRGINYVGQKVGAWSRHYAYENPGQGAFPPAMENVLRRRVVYRSADIASLAAFNNWFMACVRRGDLDYSAGS